MASGVTGALAAASFALLAAESGCGKSGSDTPAQPPAIALDRDPLIVTGVVGERTRYDFQVINKGGPGLTLTRLSLDRPADGGVPRPIADGGSVDQPIIFVDAGTGQPADGGDAGPADGGDAGPGDGGDAGTVDGGDAGPADAGDAGPADAGAGDGGDAGIGYVDPGPTGPGDPLPVVIGGAAGFVHFDYKPSAVGVTNLVISIDSNDPARPHLTSTVTACAQLPDGGGASPVCSCFDGGC